MSPRPLLVPLTLIVLLLSCGLAQAEALPTDEELKKTPRQWTSVAGSTLSATLVSYTKDQVTLRREAGGQDVVLKTSLLGPNEQRLIFQLCARHEARPLVPLGVDPPQPVVPKRDPVRKTIPAGEPFDETIFCPKPKVVVVRRGFPTNLDSDDFDNSHVNSLASALIWWDQCGYIEIRGRDPEDKHKHLGSRLRKFRNSTGGARKEALEYLYRYHPEVTPVDYQSTDTVSPKLLAQVTKGVDLVLLEITAYDDKDRRQWTNICPVIDAGDDGTLSFFMWSTVFEGTLLAEPNRNGNPAYWIKLAPNRQTDYLQEKDVRLGISVSYETLCVVSPQFP